MECAHPACTCQVTAASEFCDDLCMNPADVTCSCPHQECEGHAAPVLTPPTI